MFACEGPLSADASAADLAQRYGADAVVTRDVPLGEGMSEKGTVMWPDTPAELQVLWIDTAQQRRPRRIIVREDGSPWKTREGIATGTDLRAVEKLNGQPFRLSGFGWDYGGTVTSWAGGRIDKAAASACRLLVRFATSREAGERPEYRQVLGDDEFASDHAAMQTLNPRVFEMVLEFAAR